MRIPALPTMFLLALLTVQGASAASAASPWGLLGMEQPYSVGDDDGDGYAEVRVDAVTPPCGGLYPVVGGGADVHAAGQHVYAVGATSLCQYGVWADVDPDDADPLAGASVTPVVILWLP